MPKVNKEPVRKSRIDCTCAKKGEDVEGEEKKNYDDCLCSLVGQRDSGKRFKIKNIHVNPLAEPDIESYLLGEL